jgi:hypothetical protein
MGNVAERDAIHEAAFRYMFEHKAAGRPPTAQVYCIGVGSRGQEADPSKSLIERFRDHAPQVVSRSACTILDRGAGVRHDATSASALIFRVEAVRWTSDAEVEVDGGYYQSGFSSSRNTYHLKKGAGVWRVERDVLRSIS